MRKKLIKKKLVKKLFVNGVSFASAAFIGFSSIFAYADDDFLDNTTDHTDESFEDFEYADLDMDSFNKLGGRLLSLVNKNADFSEIEEVIVQMDQFYSQAEANYCISNIYTTLDSDNEEYGEIYDGYHDFLVDLDDQYYIYLCEVANSDYADELEDYIDDASRWDDIVDYEPLTDRQKELIDKEDELSKKYDIIYNDDYTYEIDGVEYTLDELTDALNDISSDIDTYDALLGVGYIKSQRNQALGELFIELVEVRTELAESYGYDNYAVYAYEKIYNREYSPYDLEEYCESVKEYYSPLLPEIQDYYSENFSDSRDRDDTYSQQEILDMFEAEFPNVSEDLYESFDYMVSHNLCNLDVLEKKAPTSYTTTIGGDYNCPYLTVDADGSLDDLSTLIHEFGHYNAAYYQSPEDYLHDDTNLDVAEIHSQGLELIYSKFADELYGDIADEKMCYSGFEGVYVVIEGCKENEFQLRVYEDPYDLTVDKLNELYYDVSVEYGDADLFYDSYYLGMYGYGDIKKNQILEWVEIPHTFQSPLYYISYSVSMAAVEELRDIINDDYDAGVEAYFSIVEFGCMGEYSEALAVAGVNNPLENPRFDVYAENVMEFVGMSPSSDSNDDDDSITDKKDKKDKKEKKDKKDKKDSKDKSDETTDEDADESGSFAMKDIAYIIIAAGLFIIIVLVVVIIIVICTSNKKKKEVLENGNNKPLDNNSAGNEIKDSDVANNGDVPINSTSNDADNDVKQDDDDRFKPVYKDNDSDKPAN